MIWIFSDLIDFVHDGGEPVLTFLGREVVELFGLVAQERFVVVVVVVIPNVVLVFVMTEKFKESFYSYWLFTTTNTQGSSATLSGTSFNYSAA